MAVERIHYFPLMILSEHCGVVDDHFRVRGTENPEQLRNYPESVHHSVTSLVHTPSTPRESRPRYHRSLLVCQGFITEAIIALITLRLCNVLVMLRQIDDITPKRRYRIDDIYHWFMQLSAPRYGHKVVRS